jgi:penicillin-binding protein-related factor A (putative recombinase)
MLTHIILAFESAVNAQYYAATHQALIAKRVSPVLICRMCWRLKQPPLRQPGHTSCEQDYM